MTKVTHKGLLFDIEIIPHKSEAYHWENLKFTNPIESKIIDRSSIVTIGYKWIGSKKTRVLKVDPDDIRSDTLVLTEFSKIFAEADYAVFHYGAKFDLPFINGRLVLNGLPPLPKILCLDTYALTKRFLLFRQSNKLGDLGEMLNIGAKLPTDWGLWKKVIVGDDKALNYMAKYCGKDVDLLEKYFEKILPYVETGLNKALLKHIGSTCPSCGSTHTQRRGTERTKTRLYHRHQCQGCGKWFRGEIIKHAQ